MNASSDQQEDNVWMLRMAVVACVLSFISVYVSGRNHDIHGDGWNNNYNIVDPSLREACMAALFLILCPSFGTLMEFVPLLPHSKGEQDVQRQVVIKSKLNMTLTLAEKSIFVVGILCLSVLYPTLPHTNADAIVRISVSFFKCSTTLMVCAILCFLCRRSTSFALWNTRVIVVLVCASGVIGSCALLHDDARPTQTSVLFLASNVLFDVAALVYAGTCLRSLVRWFRQSSWGRRGNKVDNATATDGQGSVHTKGGSGIEETAIKQLVVGTHMFSTFVVMTVNAVSGWFAPSLTVYQLSIVIYIMLGTALLVFVSDSFARFRIAVAAMNALLDAKTNYVRYISHEIRTPLSATLMGLRLMLDDFKQSRPRPGSVDADRLDTLTDINSSCVAALDILNDLLCFNKLEAGLLEVHKEVVCPGAFVKESVAMFNVQARDSGVVLSVVLNRPPNDNDGNADGNDNNGDGNDDGSLSRSVRRATRFVNTVLPRRGSSSSSSGGRMRSEGLGRSNSLASVVACMLLESDTVSLDKFKLDQVIRNLVSNAIKFSPRGGAVTVYAYFDAEPLPVAPAITVAAQHSHNQFSVGEGQHDRAMRRGSFLDQLTGRRANGGGGSVVGSRGSLSRQLVRILSNDRKDSLASPIPPVEGSQVGGGASPVVPQAPTTTTTLGKLVVVVADNGPGISAENQKRLFKEVIQFSPEKLQAGGGSGFGLFITKSIVDLHDGAIGVYSAGEGKGTRFTLELPMSRTTAIVATTTATQSNNLPPGAAADQRNSKMLLLRAPAPGATDVAASASLTRQAATTRGQPFADSRNSYDHRHSAVASAPAPNTLGCTPIAAAAAAVATDARLDAVRRALNDHQPSASRSGSPSDSRRATFSPDNNGFKGSLMLRELSRHNAMNPQSGSVSYSVASKHGMYLGSPFVSQHNRESPLDFSAKALSVKEDANALSAMEGREPAPASGTVAAPDATAPKWDILVVDDSPLNRKMLVKTLRAVGHTCEEAGNGQEGVEMVQRRGFGGGANATASSRPYDVVLMDFIMPVMDGPTATRTLRTAPQGLEYTGPIIGLTGNAMPADINHFMAHGASAVLIKPIDMAIFNATMKQIIAAK